MTRTANAECGDSYNYDAGWGELHCTLHCAVLLCIPVSLGERLDPVYYRNSRNFLRLQLSNEAYLCIQICHQYRIASLIFYRECRINFSEWLKF